MRIRRPLPHSSSGPVVTSKVLGRQDPTVRVPRWLQINRLPYISAVRGDLQKLYRYFSSLRVIR